MKNKIIIGMFTLISLTGCAVPQPYVQQTVTPQVRPFYNQSYYSFENNKRMCYSRAAAVANNTYDPYQNGNLTNNLVGGGLMGAAGGALLGAIAGNAGEGAAIGGGVGLLAGGLNSSYQNQNNLNSEQRINFNNTYARCMQAHGEIVVW